METRRLDQGPRSPPPRPRPLGRAPLTSRKRRSCRNTADIPSSRHESRRRHTTGSKFAASHPSGSSQAAAVNKTVGHSLRDLEGLTEPQIKVAEPLFQGVTSSQVSPQGIKGPSTDLRAQSLGKLGRNYPESHRQQNPRRYLEIPAFCTASRIPRAAPHGRTSVTLAKTHQRQRPGRDKLKGRGQTRRPGERPFQVKTDSARAVSRRGKSQHVTHDRRAEPRCKRQVIKMTAYNLNIALDISGRYQRAGRIAKLHIEPEGGPQLELGERGHDDLAVTTEPKQDHERG